MNLNYDKYNREERYLCSHLFRLLHEPVDGYRVLREFLGHSSELSQFRIYAEVALIRDAYHARKPDVAPFMDDLVRLIMTQEEVTECRLYSELPEDIRDIHKTHPKQIKHKAENLLLDNEKNVYGALQCMFNAKPDLAICLNKELVVYEAKFTLGFDAEQTKRTKNIGEVWAKLLYSDLGFANIPKLKVRTLGLSNYSPDVSWEHIYEIAERIYPETDRTRIALKSAVNMSN